MSPSVPTVFVCGATGSQGGALVRQLRELKWNVHSTVRDMTSPAARNLKELGVILTEGDWDNGQALSASLAGCDKLFLCLFPNFADPGSELRQAKNILSLAKAAGVKQVVASTSLGVSQLDAGGSDVEPGSFMAKHLTSKKSIEEAVKDTGFEYFTFLRPAFFMANFLFPKNARYPEIREKGTWATAMTSETRLPLIDHVDIARLAAAAFQHPESFHGRALGLASELLTVQETLDELAKASGRPGEFKAIFLTDEEIAETKQKNPNTLVNYSSVMRSMSNYVDTVELARMLPEGDLTTFHDFLDREKEGVRQTYGERPPT